jgi:hypothetical protein
VEQVQGQCIFEKVAPVDLIDAVNTLKGRDGIGIAVPPPGDGVDKLLSWAVADVKMSAQAKDANDRERFAANAILNARRALACLVDWYIQRDCFSLCKLPPDGAQRQSEILRKRGIIDELTSHVLERAVDKRNVVEHQFIAPALEVAEDVVELLRRSIKCLVADSDPTIGPCLFGGLSYGVGYGKKGERAAFYGWREPAFILCTFVEEPWLGVIIPDSRDKDKAVVRRSFFNETDVNTLIELLAILERTFGRIAGGMGSAMWRLLAKETGLASTV